VLAHVVGAGDVAADGGVQLGQGQPRRRGGLAAHEVAGQLGQQLGVQRAEQPLHLAPALGAPDGRVDKLDAQIGGHLAEVGAGEVAVVVDVQHVGDAADRPGRGGLTPDRLAQRQRCVQRGRGAEEHRVPGDRAGVVVDHRGQPRPRGRPIGVEDQDVELGVVGLPEGVGPAGTVPPDQLEPVPERRLSLLGEG
jgi:hypothetical protein